MKDGLSRDKRIQRLDVLHHFTPLDNRMEILLRQAEEIAGFLRYYNLNNKEEATFDAFLKELHTIRISGKHEPNGNMEPAQALLYTFLHQFQSVLQTFNTRWDKQFIPWYINRILGMDSAKTEPDFAWVQLKHNNQTLWVKKGMGFTCSKANAEKRVYFRIPEKMQINPAELVQMQSLYFERNPDVFPANLFNLPVAVYKKNLLETAENKPLFPEKTGKKSTQPLGLMITTPSLLLGEGKREVELRFETEDHKWGGFPQRRMITSLIAREQEREPTLSRKSIKEAVLIKLFSDIFYLEISTAQGWEPIDKNRVEYDNQSLLLRFYMDESFSRTTACNEETQGVVTEFPALKIILNQNAWLFPLAWLKDFFIQKIQIHTKVEGITNIQFYNELGKIDTSKPFSPFGINTEQGAWFVMGNYEMAVKNTQRAGVKIRWHQLPRSQGGLFEYYSEYQNEIDNHTFRLRPRYLSDYKWENTSNKESLFMFSTLVKEKDGTPEAKGKLAEESFLQNINMEEVIPVQLTEEDYQYSIYSKNGFLSFILDEPEIGFGEKKYRQLYTQLLMSKAFRKNGAVEINTPLNPQIERITLSYEAEDVIDFRTEPLHPAIRVYHMHALDEKQVYPQPENKPVPFVHALDTEASLLFAFDHIVGFEQLNLFFDFFPNKNEVSLFNLPDLVWFWGDGYSWKPLPDGAVVKNTTRNMLTSGLIRIQLPAIPPEGFRDANGWVWIRVGILRNKENVAPIAAVHTNAARVVRDPAFLHKELIEGFVIDQPEEKLPGVLEIQQLTPLQGGQNTEGEKEKCLRMSEYATHRDRAICARDYERMTLQEFPEIRKVKCLFGFNEIYKRKVDLVIIPEYIPGQDYSRPCASPELLLQVEEYFNKRTTGFITAVDAMHPIYEEVAVRCELVLNRTNYSEAVSRALIIKVINLLIAPWQRKKEAPVLGYSFSLQDLYKRIECLNQVVEIKQLSAFQLVQDSEAHFRIKEYTKLNESVTPSCSHAVLVPSKEHEFVSMQDRLGVDELKIHENFVIWQNGTEKH